MATDEQASSHDDGLCYESDPLTLVRITVQHKSEESRFLLTRGKACAAWMPATIGLWTSEASRASGPWDPRAKSFASTCGGSEIRHH